MNIRTSMITAACALALVACADESPASAPETATPAETPAGSTPADAAAPAAETPAPVAETPAAASAGEGKPAAVVNDCSTEIEGTDAMQYSVGSITVPSSCTEFTITLRHVGQMPIAAMGHNVVISQASDREQVAKDGMAAGVDGDYVKADDPRVVAHTELIGGGETTSVTFPVSEIQGEGPYEFFCSFPGHWTVMKGSIQVG